MSPEQWSQVVELFHAAREKTAGERVAVLDSACSNDSSLRLAVEQMLRDDEAAGSFLNESPLRFANLDSSGTATARRGSCRGTEVRTLRGDRSSRSRRYG